MRRVNDITVTSDDRGSLRGAAARGRAPEADIQTDVPWGTGPSSPERQEPTFAASPAFEERSLGEDPAYAPHQQAQAPNQAYSQPQDYAPAPAYGQQPPHSNEPPRQARPHSSRSKSARKTTKAAPRSITQPQRMVLKPGWRLRLALRRPARLATILGGLGALGLLPAILFATPWGAHRLASWENSALVGSADLGLRINEIYVEGRSRTPADKLVEALGLKRGDPILGIDLAAAKHQIEALAWVKSAVIERRLPGVLYVSLQERDPIAIWQNKGVFTLVDREGMPVPDSLDNYPGLLLVVGEDAPVNAAELIETLQSEPDLMSRVKAAQRVGNRRWNIKLDDLDTGCEVRLPEEGTEDAWHHLAQLDHDNGLLKQKLSIIDLRLPDRLVVKSEPDPAAEAAAALRKKLSNTPGKDA